MSQDTASSIAHRVRSALPTACDSSKTVWNLSQSYYNHTETSVRSTCLGSSFSFSVGFLYIGERNGSCTQCGRYISVNLFAGSAAPSLG